jgi:anti-sigma regulatory factor (Ser/Thr protein kinase)
MESVASYIIRAEINSLPEMRHFISKSADEFGVAPSARYDILLAVTEMVTNVIQHGYKGQPGMIELQATRNGDAFEVCIKDQAPPFDPTQAPIPDVTLPLEKRPLGGLGIHLTRHFVDEMVYHYDPHDGNELKLVKRGVFQDS